MRTRRGYKVKIYPNKETEQILLRHIGSTRFVYNYFLNLKKEKYLTEGKNITYKQMAKELTQLRKNTDWMQEIQSQPLQQSLRQLDVAYNRFFRKQSRFPQFKSKYGKNTMHKVNGWSVIGNTIKVMNGITIRFRGTFPLSRVGTLTISRTSTGDWFASTYGFIEKKQPKLKGAIGIDLGLKDLIITSGGEKFASIKILDKFKKKIRFASQSLARKTKGSKNRAKVKLVLARLHKKVGNMRLNHLHHVSKAIVDKNHAMIVVEDLAVKNMMQNRKLSRTIGDASWGELLRQITYKQIWNGGEVVKINRFFPSSKTCSTCNFILPILPLEVRNWECPRCKTEHDRDINAAKNILKQGVERLGAERKALALTLVKTKLSSVKHEKLLGIPSK